jgi:hypothetical protein
MSPTFETAEKFLEWVNREVEDGPYRKEATKLRFAESIDYVFFGVCSTTATGHCPESIDGGRRPNAEYFRQMLADKAPSRVLVLAECCGQYCDSFQQGLRDLFPEVTFLHPYIEDYCQNAQPGRVARSLVIHKILVDKS